MSGGLKTLLYPLIGLAGSLLMSRVISGVALIVFAVHAGPEPFAPFGMYLASVTILWVVVCGRYEQAIVFAASEREAAALARLAARIGIAVVAGLLTAALVWLILGMPLPATLQQHPLLLAAASLSLGVRAGSQILLNLATREGNFTAVSRANWVQAMVQASLQLGLLWAGLTPVACLAVADAAGLVAAGWLVIQTTRTSRAALAARLSPAEIAAAASRWRMMPAWNMPTSLLSVAALSAPALLIPLVYPVGIAAQLVFCLRLMEVPANVFASAATPILQKHLAVSAEKTSFLWLALGLLGGVATLTFTLVGGGTLVFAWLFDGTRWQTAVAAIPWVAPYFAGLAVSGPLVSLVGGLRAERQAVWCHGAFMALTAVAAVLAVSGVAWQGLLIAFGVAMLVRVVMFSGLLIGRARASDAPRAETGNAAP